MIRFIVKGALRIFCPHIRVNDKRFLQWNGPLILASNHPNAFLDAILLATLMKEPVHFLALGEVTERFLGRRFLEAFKMISIYRLKDNLLNQERNEKSFAACVDVLLKNGIVLIFSEGICENNWTLRPVKKTTARIAYSALNHPEMQSGLRILPAGLNYNSYTRPGKTVLVQFGEPITYRDLATGTGDAEQIQILNLLLKERLSSTMLQTEKHPEKIQMIISNNAFPGSGQIKNMQDKLDENADEDIFSKLIKPGLFINSHHPLGQSLILVFILAVPAALGWVLHILLFYPMKIFIKRKTVQTVYFDSVFFTSLVLAYPLYWAGWNIFGYFLLKEIWIQVLLIGMPLLAWTTVLWNENSQRVRNYFILSPQERKRIIPYVS